MNLNINNKIGDFLSQVNSPFHLFLVFTFLSKQQQPFHHRRSVRFQPESQQGYMPPGFLQQPNRRRRAQQRSAEEQRAQTAIYFGDPEDGKTAPFSFSEEQSVSGEQSGDMMWQSGDNQVVIHV